MHCKSWHRSFGGAGPHRVPAGRVAKAPAHFPAHMVAVAQLEERPVVDGMVGSSSLLGDPRYELPKEETKKVETQPMEVQESAGLE